MGSAIVTQVATEPQYVCGAAMLGCARAQKSRQNTTPTADCAGTPQAEKNRKIRSQEQCVS